jgi:hypothetical protein
MRTSNGKGIPIIPYPVGSGLGCRSSGVYRPRRSRVVRCTAVHWVDAGVPKEMKCFRIGKECKTERVLLSSSSFTWITSLPIFVSAVSYCVLLPIFGAALSLSQIDFFGLCLLDTFETLESVPVVSTCSCYTGSVDVERSNASRWLSKPSALCHLLLFLTSSGLYLGTSICFPHMLEIRHFNRFDWLQNASECHSYCDNCP